MSPIGYVNLMANTNVVSAESLVNGLSFNVLFPQMALEYRKSVKPRPALKLGHGNHF